MKKLFVFLTICLSSAATFGQHFNVKYGSPIVVFTKTNPWLMVLGSDVPSFVAYQNGQIIYNAKTGKTSKYFQVKLSPEELKKTLSKLGITDSLLKLPKQIDASSASDQPTNELLLNFDTLTKISVYGNLRGDEKARSQTPKPFLNVYDNLIGYKNNSATDWMPDSIEVMATGYSYAPEKSMPWPKDWPNLKNTTTVKRSNNLYSIYLDKKYYADFIRLLFSLKEKQAIKISGKKFSLSYRLPFPNLR
ncbi:MULTISPECIES: hypothetical protein [unclassified Mucilaginibacter]|uniref:hypothetical protein n=1 Tax=unclassified Mucilaginibacter TaxID=2617802 RepID=UPI002AC9CEEF|nr:MULTISPECIES: hypothetical protein [unclassified Mucilaginibacter]MEB0261000.1 hypothetical protein [Mucilaginibacter sp. 10I4]MEB0279595.1 hypothetical protein [Mucilaginibacter sp. 10B2]MEB0300342.1 hypothetical protein [Mucilaginibacter sp. 5C4]WPX22537.1 hypothetical protein RHM67_14745 [Mucilaginibacter sp. 5C4]